VKAFAPGQPFEKRIHLPVSREKGRETARVASKLSDGGQEKPAVSSETIGLNIDNESESMPGS
jgi:hypothetical protein